MHHAKRARHQWIGQFNVELLNLRRQHQALVDNRAAGKRGNVKKLLALYLRIGYFIFCPAANAVEQALEGVFIHACGLPQKQLLDVGLRRARFAADSDSVHRRIAPANYLQPLFLRNALDHALGLQAAVLLNRQKTHGHAIGARLRQLHSQLAAFAHKKSVWNLYQDARAVARLRIAARRAAMRQVDEHFEALADNIVTFYPAYARNQPHAAGIVLVPRMIKTLRMWTMKTSM